MKHLIPYKIRNDCALQPSQCNANFLAMQNALQDVQAQRWLHFAHVLDLGDFSNATGSDSRRHYFKPHADCFVRGVEVQFYADVSDEFQVVLNGATGWSDLSVNGGGAAGTRVKLVENVAARLDASTEVYVDLTTAATSYNVTGCRIILHCVADSYRSASALSGGPDPLDLSAYSYPKASEFNSRFTQHATDVAALALPRGMIIHSVVAPLQGKSIIPSRFKRHFLPAGSGSSAPVIIKLDLYSYITGGSGTMRATLYDSAAASQAILQNVHSAAGLLSTSYSTSKTLAGDPWNPADDWYIDFSIPAGTPTVDKAYVNVYYQQEG